MYLEDLEELQDLQDLEQTFWQKLKEDIRRPIQEGIQSARRQAEERVREETVKFVEQRGQQFWDKIFGQQSPKPIITGTPTVPTSLPSINPVHIGLVIGGSVLLLYILSRQKQRQS